MLEKLREAGLGIEERTARRTGQLAAILRPIDNDTEWRNSWWREVVTDDPSFNPQLLGEQQFC